MFQRSLTRLVDLQARAGYALVPEDASRAFGWYLAVLETDDQDARLAWLGELPGATQRVIDAALEAEWSAFEANVVLFGAVGEHIVEAMDVRVVVTPGTWLSGWTSTRVATFGQNLGVGPTRAMPREAALASPKMTSRPNQGPAAQVA